MSYLQNIVRGLQQKHLLPVAAALLLALGVVPVVFLKGSESPKTAAATSSKAAKTNSIEQPITQTSVSSDTTQRQEIRTLKTRNPFRQQGGSAPSADAGQVEPTESDDSPFSSGSGSSASSSSGSSSGSSTSSGTSTTTETTTTSASKRGYLLWTISVRFGAVSGSSLATLAEDEVIDFGNLSRKRLRRKLKPVTTLPSSKNPIVAYLGISSHSRSAIFLLGRDVKHEGEGTCIPSPTRCELLYLREDSARNEHILYKDPSRRYGIKLKDINLTRVKSLDGEVE